MPETAAPQTPNSSGLLQHKYVAGSFGKGCKNDDSLPLLQEEAVMFGDNGVALTFTFAG